MKGLLVVLSVLPFVLAQVEELALAGVADAIKCSSCCADLLLDEPTLLFSACQTGCNDNINAIDQDNQAQLDSFNAGNNFFRLGTTAFNDNTFFCSTGGSVQRIFDDVDEASCQQCCVSINGNFDLNDVYDLQACLDACVDGFADDCNDLESGAEQLGCAIGLLFIQDGGSNFFENTNHFCSNVGELFSLQAIEVKEVDGAGVAQDSECELCCDAIGDETNVDALECRAGCDPTIDCADAANEEDCEVGKLLATTSITAITGGSQVACFAPGIVERFVEVDVEVGLLAEDLAVVFGASFGGVAALGLIGFFVSRRRRNTDEGFQDAPRGAPNIVSGGGFFSRFRSPRGATMDNPRSASYGGRQNDMRTNPAPAGKGFFARFRRNRGGDTGSAKGGFEDYGGEKKKGIFGRFFKRKRGNDNYNGSAPGRYEESMQYGNNDPYDSRFNNQGRGGQDNFGGGNNFGGGGNDFGGNHFRDDYGQTQNAIGGYPQTTFQEDDFGPPKGPPKNRNQGGPPRNRNQQSPSPRNRNQDRNRDRNQDRSPRRGKKGGDRGPPRKKKRRPRDDDDY